MIEYRNIDDAVTVLVRRRRATHSQTLGPEVPHGQCAICAVDLVGIETDTRIRSLTDKTICVCSFRCALVVEQAELRSLYPPRVKVALK